MRHLFKGGVYSGAALIRVNTVYDENDDRKANFRKRYPPEGIFQKRYRNVFVRTPENRTF